MRGDREMPSREPDALPHKNNINRANVEETDHGLKVCWGLHASGHECEWEYFVPDAERQRLREALRRIPSVVSDELYGHDTGDMGNRIALAVDEVVKEALGASLACSFANLQHD